MYMVKCEEKYWPFVLKLRNNFRHSFFSQGIISYKVHEKFMRKWSDNYFVCISQDGETKLGWVGVVDNDIRIAVAPEFQKQGVGKFMLQYIKDKYPKAISQIASSNVASMKLFESVGILIKEI
jgi:ribosomal protein S18 acetylase RimI-like enzyme